MGGINKPIKRGGGINKNGSDFTFTFHNQNKMEEVCSLNTTYIYTTEELPSLKYELVSWMIVVIIEPFVAIIGLIVNGLFLFTVFRVREMRTVTNIFLGQLSVCDVAALCFTTLKYLIGYLWSQEYEFLAGISALLCTIFDFGMYVTYFIGVFIIFALSVERYMAVCKPIYYHLFMSNARAAKTSLTCWIAGFALAIPTLIPQMIITVCGFVPNNGSSSSTTTANENWMVFETCQPCTTCLNSLFAFDTIQFVIVFACNSIMYFEIIKALHKRSAGIRKISATAMSQQKSQRVEHYISRMLITNGYAFFFLLGPYEIWNTFYLIREYTGVLPISEEAFYWLGYGSRVVAVNFAVNPLIYAATNPSYREAFFKAIGYSRLAKTQPGMNSVNTLSASII